LAGHNWSYELGPRVWSRASCVGGWLTVFGLQYGILEFGTGMAMTGQCTQLDAIDFVSKPGRGKGAGRQAI
jgi:hypothetical protein